MFERFFQGLEFIETAKSYLFRSGVVELLVGDEIESFERFRADAELSVPENFNPKLVDLFQGDWFYVVGKDGAGRVVLTQALRYEDLKRETLYSVLLNRMPRLGMGDPEELTGRCHDVSGKVVYHGGAWVHSEFSNLDLASCAVRMALAIAYFRYEPDFVYGFTDNPLVLSGFSKRKAVATSVPLVLTWRKRPQTDSDQYCFSYNRGSDLGEMIHHGHSVYNKRA